MYHDIICGIVVTIFKLVLNYLNATKRLQCNNSKHEKLEYSLRQYWYYTYLDIPTSGCYSTWLIFINISEGIDVTNGCICWYIWLLSMFASPSHLPFGLVYKEDGDKMFVFRALSETSWKSSDFMQKLSNFQYFDPNSRYYYT